MNALRIAGAWIKSNASPILVGTNIALGAYACYLTGKGAVKAYEIIHTKKPRTKKELARCTWKCFIPAAIAFGGSTLSAIAGHKIDMRRQAALASAAAISETALTGVTKHMTDELSKGKAEKVVASALQEEADKNLPSQNEIQVVDKDGALVQDSITGQWLRVSLEHIAAARNVANDMMNQDGSVFFNDFLDAAGFNTCDAGGEIGWRSMEDGLFDVTFVGGATPFNDEPYVITNYSPRPTIIDWNC